MSQDLLVIQYLINGVMNHKARKYLELINYTIWGDLSNRILQNDVLCSEK